MKTQKKRTAVFWLCIALVICLISAVGASFVQTNFGKVTIRDLRFEAASGHYLSALLLTPENATAENPAPRDRLQPRVVQQPGNAGSELCGIRATGLRCDFH